MSVESRYRIGMAHYMLREYEAAAAAFSDSLALVSRDDDMCVADIYWLVLSLLRAGQDADAHAVLRKHYAPDMYVGHHTAYEKAMRVAAGFAELDEMLSELEAEPEDLQYAMAAYGLMVLLESRGEQARAAALRGKILRRDGFWYCFSYLAAYSDAAHPQVV